MTRKDFELIADTLQAVRAGYAPHWDPNLFRACNGLIVGHVKHEGISYAVYVDGAKRQGGFALVRQVDRVATKLYNQVLKARGL